MNKKMVTIKSFDNYTIATIWQGALETHNITSVIINELTGKDYIFSKNGPPALQVSIDDEARTRDILNKLESMYYDTTEECEINLSTTCPKCHTEDISFKSNSLLFFLFSMILLFIPYFYRKKLICNKCKNEWERKNRSYPLDLILIFIVFIITTFIIFYPNIKNNLSQMLLLHKIKINSFSQDDMVNTQNNFTEGQD